MSDLISRSALIEILEDYENDDWNKNISAMLPSVVDDCIDFIENMPTAYDSDRVVEELEKIRAKKTCNKEKCDTKEICRICVVDDAIEIVKHGCVDDDVCEWKGKEKEYIQNPHTKRLYSNEESMKNCYCNTCGKKIKVAE